MKNLLPLGLPEGSVRAILAIAIVFTFCALVLWGKPAPEQFLSIVLAVVTCYFATRNNNTPPTGLAPVTPPSVTVVPIPVPSLPDISVDPTNPAVLTADTTAAPSTP